MKKILLVSIMVFLASCGASKDAPVVEDVIDDTTIIEDTMDDTNTMDDTTVIDDAAVDSIVDEEVQ
ncbi:MAG: hypothetical protein Q8M44_07145 [bacterium]|nr:hypothetical protein [bacterium]